MWGREREPGIHRWRMSQIFREFSEIVNCLCSSVNDDTIKCIVSRLSSECSYRYGSLKFLRHSLYFWSKLWWRCALCSIATSWRSLWLTDIYVQKSRIHDAPYSCPQHYHHINNTARPWKPLRYRCMTYSGACVGGRGKGGGVRDVYRKSKVVIPHHSHVKYCLNIGACTNSGYQTLFPSPTLIRAWVWG